MTGLLARVGFVGAHQSLPLSRLRALAHSVSFRDKAVLTSSTNQSGGELRVPDAAFAPAGVFSSQDWPINAAGADTLPLRGHHWWSYTRMGMTSGYFELAGATTGDGGNVAFGWQASVFPSDSASYAAYKDGLSRTGQWGSTGWCTSSLQVPCGDVAYQTQDGSLAQYTVFQVHQCMGEVKAAADTADTFNNNGDAITQVEASIIVSGAHILASACKGASAPVRQNAPAKRPAKPAPAKQPQQPQGFHGSCYAYRGTLWSYAQRESPLLSLWWSDLQAAYNNNYPPPSGGSVPGVTQDQFQTAQSYMNQIHLQLANDSSHSGIEYELVRIGQQYGIKDLNRHDAFAWAMQKVFGTAYFLDQAAYEEWKAAGSGLGDYHNAQQSLSNSWDALRQLPCRS